MPPESTNILVSVVVCTLNRAQLLQKCLESLADQDISVRRYEVIIVDNGSTDDTGEVINRFLCNYGHFRCMKEEQPGLSFARNRGWREAYGHYVAYIDDDARACPDWISSIVEYVGRHPDAGVFGGPYEGFYLVPRPEWFPPEYGCLDLGDQERPIALGSEWITGSNMVIKKELFHRYGGFDVRLGMSGEKCTYGEEVNFFLSLHDKGIQIFYTPSIKVKHLVAEYKMSLKWLLFSGYSIGRHYELTFNVKRSLLSHLSTLITACGGAVLTLLRPASMPLKRRLFYSFHRVYYEVGAVVEHCSTYFTTERNDAPRTGSGIYNGQ